MERIDKQAILHRTHYGLGIYAHILRQCFPADEVALTLSGRDCGLCRNPFAEGARTLHVFIHKTDPTNALSPEYARHTTTDQSIPDGDAFDFAQLHYQQSDDELLSTLNHEMHLHIGEKNLWYNKKNGRADGAPVTPAVETSYHGVSHNASLLPLREVGRVSLSSCRRKGTSPAGNEAKGFSVVELPLNESVESNQPFTNNFRSFTTTSNNYNHGVSRNPSPLPLREVGRVSFSSCRRKGTSPAGNEAKETQGSSLTAQSPQPLAQCFSFFKSPISNTKPYQNITIRDAYNYIVGTTAKDRTLALRTLTDAKQSRMYKAANFDYCTFSGTFRTRSDKALIQHSGMLCIDFDHLQHLDALRIQLLQDEYFDTQLLFRSPSGDGLKWIIQIDISQATHADYFRAVANYLAQTYGVEADKSGKDISRACFLPHDPQCFINPKFLNL